MKIEIVYRKIKRRLDEITVYEMLGRSTRVVSCGNTSQHHAFVRNVIDAASSYNIPCKIIS